MKKLTITVTIEDVKPYGATSNTAEAALTVNYKQTLVPNFIGEQIQEVVNILIGAAEEENKEKANGSKKESENV